MKEQTRDAARLKSWNEGGAKKVHDTAGTATNTSHWGWINGFNDGYDAASSAEWVAVEDGLPIKYGRYLVTRHRRADGARLTREAFYDDDDKTFSHTHATGSVLDDGIAWCEKPKPFKPKEKTNE